MLRRLISSPLLHFFAIGGLVFALHSALNPAADGAQRADAITLSPEAAGQLAAQFASVWGRPPDAAELDGLMRDWAEEEALVREASRPAAMPVHPASSGGAAGHPAIASGQAAPRADAMQAALPSARQAAV